MSAHLYSSSIVRGGSSDSKWKKGVESKASLKILKDRIYAVCVNLLDSLSESPGEVLNRLVFPLKDGF